MTAANSEIKTMYEDLGMTPEEIADDRGYDVSAVKAILMSCSGVYREVLKTPEGKTQDITEEQFDQINAAYVNLALYSEVDSVRARCLKNLRDEYRGRLKNPNAIKSLNLNIVQLNGQLARSREVKELAAARVQELMNKNKKQEVVDV